MDTIQFFATFSVIWWSVKRAHEYLQGYEAPLPEKFGLSYEFDKVTFNPNQIFTNIFFSLYISYNDEHIDRGIHFKNKDD